MDHGERTSNANYFVGDMPGMVSGLLREVVSNDEQIDDVDPIRPTRPDADKEKFLKSIVDANKPLYEGSPITTLEYIVRLFHIKCKNKWNNKSFDEMLEIQRNAMPHANFPSSFVETKKMIGNLGFTCKKNDACPEDCNEACWRTLLMHYQSTNFQQISEQNKNKRKKLDYTHAGRSMSHSQYCWLQESTDTRRPDHVQRHNRSYICPDDIRVAPTAGVVNVSDDVTILDAAGKYVMPGGIDPHTHLAMEFMGTQTIDNFFTGQAAALAGGTTMHIDFVIPVNGNLSAGFDSYMEKAKISVMDYGFHMAITKWDETVSEDMELMVKKNGINSFKFFMAYKGSLMINDDLLLQGFQKCKSLGALAMVHAENGDGVAEGQKKMIDLGITGPEGHALSRPPVLEAEATARAIRLASFVNTPLYVVHVMSIDAMEEIAKAKKSGQRVVGEPVVSGLVLDDSWLWDSDFTTAAKYVMSPPIRKLGHGKALQAALSTGILQLVGTDHCTFNSTQKAFGIDDFRKIPNGVNGIEERMHLIWDTMVESGQISVTDYVRITSTECARIFNIYPRKGAIMEGSDADLIILNPNASFKISATSHHSRSDTNVYEGRTGKGRVEVTISGGRIVWQEGKLNVAPGSGKYIRSPPFGYLFDGIDKADAEYMASLRAPVQRSRAAT